MGCSTLDLGAAVGSVDVRDWALDDPDGRDPADVRGIRDEIEARVAALFEEIERPLVDRATTVVAPATTFICHRFGDVPEEPSAHCFHQCHDTSPYCAVRPRGVTSGE